MYMKTHILSALREEFDHWERVLADLREELERRRLAGAEARRLAAEVRLVAVPPRLLAVPGDEPDGPGDGVHEPRAGR